MHILYVQGEKFFCSSGRQKYNPITGTGYPAAVARIPILSRPNMLPPVGLLLPLRITRTNRKNAKKNKKAAVEEVQPGVTEAQEETIKAIGAEEDDGEGGTAGRAPPKPVLSGDEKYELETAAKKARKAGNCTPQVCAFLKRLFRGGGGAKGLGVVGGGGGGRTRTCLLG